VLFGLLIVAILMISSTTAARLSGPLAKPFWIWLAVLSAVAVGTMTAAKLRPDWVREESIDIQPSSPPAYIEHI
jgi:uroporphyrinogen-III synthase